MSLPFQPRSRAALTPTAGGRMPAPSTFASGSRGRRGFTPRSASRTKAGGSRGGADVKPKLTLQQQLHIIERLETGNFKKGDGLNQFYEEFANESAANKLTCKQNLFSSFVSVDPIASSTRNYGNGIAGSMESLISVNSSVISSNTVVDDMEVTSLEVRMPGSLSSEREEDYNSLPDYIRAFDRLLSTRDIYIKKLQELADIQCSVNFAQLLPQEKMVTFFKSLERVQKMVQKFLDGNASENMKLFMPSQKTKGPPPSVIHCDVENHSQIIDAFYRLSEIIDKLDSFINQESTDFKLDAKMETFKDLVSKLEESIKTQEEYSQDVKDLVKKTEILEMDESVLRDSGTEIFEQSPSP